MKSASSRYGLAAAGLVLCLGLAACGGGGGGSGGLPILPPGQTPPAGPQQPGGEQPQQPALKCAP
ncbi:hypothetical protein NU688_04590 [Variovorax sp. ZS18.2.2]|uniref:hypothetical protein n=1 Tax=Variovorax sp. ZS18.2.2 TaxID=2971255 RepID=UPI002150F4D6|nr:hypothetical protein [Variovorax sp. ZS18.2.2]MCR6475427.1 hypothetical protein [Variovorax sp. ZS18.2.2]